MNDTSQPDAYAIDSAAIAAALWRRKWRVLISTFVLLALTFVALMFVPKSYQSSASILVERRDTGILSGTGGNAGSGGVVDTAAVASQMEVIQSRDTLLDAISSAKLYDEPILTKTSQSPLAPLLKLIGLGSTPKTALAIDKIVLANVQKGLTVIQERDSRVITVIFKSGDPELAAKVANAVAETYVKRRAGQVVEDTADATSWLRSEIDKLRKRVAESDSKIAAFKVDKDLFVGPNNTSLTDQQLSTVSAQISAAHERQSTAQSRAAVIGKMVRSGQNVESIPEIGGSPVVQRLLEQRGALQAERAQKLATLLPTHPAIKSLDTQIGAIDQQIRSEAKRVVSSLEAQAQVEGDVVQSLKDELTRLKLSASGAARNSVTLAGLERESKAQRDLLENYLLKYRDAAARTDSNSALPDVRIVSYAAASSIPASPKVGLIMLATFLVSVVGQVGFILFGELVSGRALVEREDYVPASLAVEPDDVEPQDKPGPDDQEFDPYEPRLVPAAAQENIAPAVAENWHDDAPVAFGEDAPGALGDESDYVEQEGDAAQLSSVGINALPQAVVEPMSEHVEEFQGEPVAEPSGADERAAEVEQGQVDLSAASGEQDEDTEYGEPDPLSSVKAQDTPISAPPFAREVGQPRSEMAEPTLDEELAPIIERLHKGQERVVFLADTAGREGSDNIVDALVVAVRQNEQSVAIVDAAGGPPGANLGLTELCMGQAGFGDVVQRTRDGDVALVPWGQGARLDPRSSAPLTLVQALLDIFDVVLVATGRPGMASSLPAFAGLSGALVVGGAHDAGPRARSAIKVDAAALGFSRIHLLKNDTTQTRVA